jgi:protein YibB
MKNPVTLVTAYFNIGRDDFKLVPRSEERYFEEFRFWARIQNPIIVFVEPRCAERVREIRAEFGLEDRTTIIEIGDIFSIQPGIRARMVDAASSSEFRDFRIMPDATSGIADYSYLMLLKSWFIHQASTHVPSATTLAWIDFSYNRGGRYYSHPQDFDFELTLEPLERVVLFTMAEYDDRPIFEIVRQLSDCITGGFYLVPVEQARFLWESTLRQIDKLLSVGFIDDDQLILLMSYRESPDRFEIRRSDWFRPIADISGRSFRIAPTKQRNPALSAARQGLHWARRTRRATKSAWKLYWNLTAASR